MFKLTLDLHGKTHLEASEEVRATLLSASHSSFEIDIITGNSDAMKDIVIEVCDNHSFNYYIPYYNNGMIVVTFFK